MHPWRQRLTSLVSAAIFLGLIYVLFKKVIVVAWIQIPWWGLLIMLIALFFCIETMVARGFGAREPVQRAGDTAKEAAAEVAGAAAKIGQGVKSAAADPLQAVKDRLAEHEKRADDPSGPLG